MPTRLIWSPQARADLIDIYLTIAVDRPQVAERFFDRLEARARELEAFPRLGPRYAELRPSVRLLSERPYAILYETTPDTDEGPVTSVAIIRVVDARRDLHRLA